MGNTGGCGQTPIEPRLERDESFAPNRACDLTGAVVTTGCRQATDGRLPAARATVQAYDAAKHIGVTHPCGPEHVQVALRN